LYPGKKLPQIAYAIGVMKILNKIKVTMKMTRSFDDWTRVYQIVLNEALILIISIIFIDMLSKAIVSRVVMSLKSLPKKYIRKYYCLTSGSRIIAGLMLKYMESWIFSVNVYV